MELFISYCREDVEIAERIDGILGRLDYDVWYADKSVPAGALVTSETYGAMTEHHTAIVLLSQNSAKSRAAQRGDKYLSGFVSRSSGFLGCAGSGFRRL